MSGAPTFGAFLEWAKAYTLEGLEKEITCPTLCMTARGNILYESGSKILRRVAVSQALDYAFGGG